MKERLIELLKKSRCDKDCDGFINSEICIGCTAYEKHTKSADYLIENGVIVTPCVAMVEQFIKDGKFNNRITAHNGKYAVVYVDKSKWSSCPLIDITEQHYNADKALERIQALKGGSEE